MKKILYPILFCALATGVQQATSLPAQARGSHDVKVKTYKAKTYRNIRGRVVAVIKPRRAGEKTALTLDHEDIPGFMRAMRMTIPLQNSADARKLKPGGKIRFDLVLKGGNFVVANIKPLPSNTRLKLAPA